MRCCGGTLLRDPAHSLPNRKQPRLAQPGDAKLKSTCVFAIVAACGWAAWASQSNATEERAIEQRTLVVTKVTKEFAVAPDELVRLSGSTPSGGDVKAEISGTARIVRINKLRQVAGSKTLLGANVAEFKIEPTGKGQVTVTIVKTTFDKSAEPTKETYVFTVQ